MRHAFVVVVLKLDTRVLSVRFMQIMRIETFTKPPVNFIKFFFVNVRLT